MKKQAIDISSLAHTKWNRKDHIVFAPKYRRKAVREKSDIAKVVPMEMCRNSRGRGVS